MPNKTTIRKFFLAVRHDDPGLVRAMIMQDPTLVAACATAPPKKDDGQSPLQVALKTGHYSIANVLMDHGADVNFMETSAINEWRAPALHDAIRGVAAWLGCRTAGFEERFPAAFGVFHRMLELGADPNARDTSDTTPIYRLVWHALQKVETAEEWAGATGEDFQKAMTELLARGADPRAVDRHGNTPLNSAKGTPLERLVEAALSIAWVAPNLRRPAPNS